MSSVSESTSEHSYSPEAVFVILRNCRVQDCLLPYNRKDKSLEKLSKGFLQLFFHETHCILSLDSVTEKLGTFLFTNARCGETQNLRYY